MNQAKLLIFTDSNIYSAEFANTWQAKGYNLQHLPLLRAENIAIKPSQTGSPQPFQGFVMTEVDSRHCEEQSDKAIQFCCDNLGGVIITSSSAIFALNKYFKNKHTKIYTISKFLAEKIKSQGYQNIYFENDGVNTYSLKMNMVKCPPQGKVLYLCGERIRKPLEFTNISIESVPVYRMVELKKNSEKLAQMIASNTTSMAYVSSEQAIEALATYKIAFENLIFKSEYLKQFAEKLMRN